MKIKFLTIAMLFALNSFAGGQDRGGGDANVIEFLQIATNICSFSEELKWINTIEAISCSDYISNNTSNLEKNKPKIIFTSDRSMVLESDKTEKQATYNKTTGEIIVFRPDWKVMSTKEKYSLVGIELSAMLNRNDRYSFGLKISQHWRLLSKLIEEKMEDDYIQSMKEVEPELRQNKITQKVSCHYEDALEQVKQIYGLDGKYIKISDDKLLKGTMPYTHIINWEGSLGGSFAFIMERRLKMFMRENILLGDFSYFAKIVVKFDENCQAKFRHYYIGDKKGVVNYIYKEKPDYALFKILVEQDSHELLIEDDVK